ncbi:hypothetical protein I79_020242 [Cricetulus griseus]|uniref:Uncharacterized protein n=1 Tax=Cricetulus griseus TaxID=10029 RepID=G3I9J5_CRIGR|nr:hypothetical protein I79_020242 [Cricetulus griseus]
MGRQWDSIVENYCITGSLPLPCHLFKVEKASAELRRQGCTALAPTMFLLLLSVKVPQHRSKPAKKEMSHLITMWMRRVRHGKRKDLPRSIAS